jgi:2-oxoglutarate ferredoxin oxidoreductase subunit delta
MAASPSQLRATSTAVIDAQACRGCGSCVDACPAGVLELANTFNEDGYTFARLARTGCLGEGHCLYACPEGAIHLETCHVLHAM